MVVDDKKIKVFKTDYANAISGFTNSMQRFPLKKILYRIIFRGKGLEFDSYRNFEPDDDASMIDWKASLRGGGGLLARKYIEERELNVYFLVDCSGSVLFGSGDKLKAEFNSEFIAALAHLVLESGDKVGLIMLNKDIAKFVSASSGKNQFQLIRSILDDVNLYGGEFDLKKGLDFALGAVKSPYTVFIVVSDFIGVKNNISQGMKFLGSKFETIAVMSRDPMDESLPEFNHQMAIVDPSTGKQLVIDPKSINNQFKHVVLKQKKAMKRIFREANVDLLELNTVESFFLPVSNFLRTRSKERRI